MSTPARDEKYMALALEQAQLAAAAGEVPVGAVVVFGDKVLAAAYNRRELDRDPTAHAEMLAIRQAATSLDAWRLSGCELFVTLEPCAMCAGAMVLARIDRLVFGATDPKAGAIQSLFSIATDSRLNHRVEVVGGVLAKTCGKVLTDFFAARRQ